MISEQAGSSEAVARTSRYHDNQRTCRQELGNETTVEESQGLNDSGVTLRAYWIKSGVTSWRFHGNPDVILYCP